MTILLFVFGYIYFGIVVVIEDYKIEFGNKIKPDGESFLHGIIVWPIILIGMVVRFLPTLFPKRQP